MVADGGCFGQVAPPFYKVSSLNLQKEALLITALTL